MIERLNKPIKTSKKYIVLFIKYIMPVILLYILLSHTDLEQLVGVMRSVNPALLVCAYMFFALNIALSSFRVREIMGRPLPFFEFFRLQSLGTFWMLILPGKFGEISFPMLWSERTGIPLGRAISVRILTRSIDYILMMLFYLLGAFLIWRTTELDVRIYAVALFIFVLVLPAILAAILILVGNKVDRVRSYLSELAAQSKKITLKLVILSVLIIFVRYAMLYCFIVSLGAKIGFLVLILSYFLLFLLKFISTFGNFGTYEFAIATALVAGGFDKSMSISLSVNVHLLHLVIIIIFGLLGYILEFKRNGSDE